MKKHNYFLTRLLAFVCFLGYHAHAQTVSTLAGTVGVAGSTDAVGTAAKFNFPCGVAVDASGNVYVADYLNHVVRKIDAGGNVSTLAGTAGSADFANGSGTAAKFNFPFGVAVDASGNVYVADQNNHLIRKIDAAGNVTTLAGTAGSADFANGSGTAAKFKVPLGVAVDASGNVYVADYNNHLIRKIDAGGNVTTLAGTVGVAGSTDAVGTAAKFNFPTGVTVDASGNVYVADQNNHLIRKIDAGGKVTTLAGTVGVAGFANGSGTAAKFYNPTGVAVDASGNVYVADYFNHVVRKIDAGGNVTTLAGTAGSAGYTDAVGTAAKFRGPTGVTVDASGNIYVGEQGNHLIRKITTASLTLGTATNPTNCTTRNGSIAFTSTGFASTTQRLNYSKDGSATSANVTIAANGTFSLTGLGAGAYTAFAIGNTAATGTTPVNLSGTTDPKPFCVTPTSTTNMTTPIRTCGSQANIQYSLYYVPTGAAIKTIVGTGNALNFGPQFFPGSYRIMAKNIKTGCQVEMSNRAHYGSSASPRMGVEDESNESDWVSIGENPVRDVLKVRFRGEVGQKVNLILSDIQGRILTNREVTLLYGIDSAEINMVGSAMGSYILNVQQNEKIKRFTILKAQ